jgi:2-methylcitrate dehydratase
MTTATMTKPSSAPLKIDAHTAVLLPRDSNQAQGIGQFAVDYMSGKVGKPATAVLERTLMFHTDAVL